MCKVTLEPNLEKQAGQWTPAKRRAAAKVYYRWAKQLWVSAQMMEAQNGTETVPPEPARG